LIGIFVTVFVDEIPNKQLFLFVAERDAGIWVFTGSEKFDFNEWTLIIMCDDQILSP
jgi:hypothetical protein